MSPSQETVLLLALVGEQDKGIKAKELQGVNECGGGKISNLHIIKL